VADVAFSKVAPPRNDPFRRSRQAVHGRAGSPRSGRCQLAEAIWRRRQWGICRLRSEEQANRTTSSSDFKMLAMTGTACVREDRERCDERVESPDVRQRHMLTPVLRSADMRSAIIRYRTKLATSTRAEVRSEETKLGGCAALAVPEHNMHHRDRLLSPTFQSVAASLLRQDKWRQGSSGNGRAPRY
jgi:hypothetical protein